MKKVESIYMYTCFPKSEKLHVAMSVQNIAHFAIHLFGQLTNIGNQNLFYVLCIVSTYPLSLLYRKCLAFPPLKHLFSIIVGFLFCYNLFSVTDVCNIFASCLVTLFVTLYFPVRWHPDLIVFAFCFLQLSVLHIYRMFANWMVWNVDATGVMMLLTIKMNTTKRECKTK